MASCSTTRVASSSGVLNSPYVKLTVVQDSETNTAATLSYTLEYIAPYAVYGGSRDYTIKIDGSSAKTGSYNLNGVTGTHTICSGTKSVSKGTSAKNVDFSVTFEFNVSYGGHAMGTRSASGTISIAGKPSYKISYSANGGSGAPSAQTKYYGTSLTLSSTKPTKSGSTFSKWKSTEGDLYSPGASYSANKSTTMTAQWTLNTYKVTFNANGGTGGPTSQTKTYGTDLTLTTSKPTRTNYIFKGWATSSSGSVVYEPGEKYTKNAAVTLYAVWEEAYSEPEIKLSKINRCLADGTLDDTGTNALINFTWSCDQRLGENKSSEIVITCNGVDTSIDTKAISGSVTNQVIGNNTLLIDSSYEVTVKVKDDRGGKTTVSSTVPAMAFPIDFKAGGKGVAIGKPATTDNLFDIALPTSINNAFSVPNHTSTFRGIVTANNYGVYGKTTTNSQYKILGISSSNNCTVGNRDIPGNTHIYGKVVKLVTDANTSGYVPYYTAGDSVNFYDATAGFTTSSSTSVRFTVHLGKPAIGVSAVSASSIDGFVFRQNTKYTHGSTADVYVKPSSYSATLTDDGCAVRIYATFSTTTNAINNDVIGIYWSGKVTFS